jgi:hypothetical protein
MKEKIVDVGRSWVRPEHGQQMVSFSHSDLWVVRG